MNKKSKCISADRCINTSGVFSGVVVYLCKANLSKTRYSLFEDKIKINGGLLSYEPNDSNITHVAVEDTLCDDINKCLNILKNAGFILTVPYNYVVVKVEWICECLKQKQKVDTECFEIKLQLNQEIQDNGDNNDLHGNNEQKPNDISILPESKKLKLDLTDVSKI